jgi:hypothetical protein
VDVGCKGKPAFGPPLLLLASVLVFAVVKCTQTGEECTMSLPGVGSASCRCVEGASDAHDAERGEDYLLLGLKCSC